MSTNPTTDLLTIEDAAALVGVSANTLRNHIRSGRIVRVNPTAGMGRGVRALYRAADVLRVYAEVTAWKGDRAAGAAVVDGMKRCSGCHAVKPVGDFYQNGQLKCGYSSQCKACQEEVGARWYQANWDRERARREAYKEAHRPQFREYRKKAYRSDPAKSYRQHRDWVEANPEHVKAYARQRLVLECGLSSPITRRAGFAIVVNLTGEWRAARLDVPFASGERAVVKILPPQATGGRWSVSAWPVLQDAALKREARLMVARLARGAKSPLRNLRAEAAK